MIESPPRPLVSVIVPTFNRGPLIQDTLLNISQQSYRPIEIVVVDDGSTDQTYQAVTEFRNRHSERTLTVQYCHQENAGQNAARNRGLITSHGSYIQFLDSDDLLHPQKIQRDIELVERTGADAVVDHVELFRDIEEIRMQLSSRPTQRPLTKSPERKPYYASHRWDGHIPFYSRPFLTTCGPFRADIRSGAGAEFAARVKTSGGKVVYSTEVMYFYRQDSHGAITKQSGENFARGKLKAQRAILETLQRAGIRDSSEWRALTIAVMTTTYRAHLLGCKELVTEGIQLVRECARRWNPLIHGLSYAPAFVVFKGVSFARHLRALLSQ